MNTTELDKIEILTYRYREYVGVVSLGGNSRHFGISWDSSAIFVTTVD